VSDILHYFDSVEAITERALTGSGPARASRTEGRDNDWDFGVGFDGAVKLAREGWPEGTAKVSTLEKKISAPIIQALERQVEFTIEPGEWIDPDRLLQGEAEVWGSVTETEVESKGARGRSAHFLVGIATSGGISADIILRRGAAIVASVDILEALGFRIKVSAYDSVTRGKDHHTGIIRLKDYHERLDVDTLSFVIAHSGFARRIGFGYQDSEPEEIRTKFGFNSGGGYGSPPFDFIPEDVTYGDDQVIKFDGMSLEDYQSDANTIKSVVATLAKFDIELDLEGGAK
jgi:hypothetical protein